MEATLNEGQSLIPVLLERIVILEKNAKASHEVWIQVICNRLSNVICRVILSSSIVDNLDDGSYDSIDEWTTT